MIISDEIKKQLRAGQGIRFDASANAIFRAVGRKEAQEAADSDKLSKLDADAKKADEDARKSKAERQKLIDPGELPENATELQKNAREAYEKSFSRHSGAESDAISRKAKKEEEAAALRAYHATLGEQKVLSADPKKDVLKDLKRFIERNVGASVCKECCELIETYIEGNPGSTLVKLKSVDNSPVVIADAKGNVVCRVDVLVSND